MGTIAQNCKTRLQSQSISESQVADETDDYNKTEAIIQPFWPQLKKKF
jgi:hypothetical protein